MNTFRIVISIATTSDFLDLKVSGLQKQLKKKANCQKKDERKLQEITHAHGPRGRFRRFGKGRFSMPALSRQMRLGTPAGLRVHSHAENDSNCPTSTDLYEFQSSWTNPKLCLFKCFFGNELVFLTNHTKSI